MGVAWLLDGLWRQLGVDTALAKVLGGRRFTTDVERVLFALVANRAIDPASKLAAAEWASNDVAIVGLESMDEDQAYRAMDLLVAADAQAEVQEAVFFAVADLLNLEVDLLFFDTTSTYFETEDEDEFRRFGKSKDHRTDLPQIVIGLAVTREGIPVRCWVWPGNTNDDSMLPEVKDDMRGWRLGRVVTVVDRGFSSDENLDYLRRAGGHCIAGEKMRDGSPDAEAALSRQGRYQKVRDNLRVKEVRLDDNSRRSGGSCATTRSKPNATPPNAKQRSTGSKPSSTASAHGRERDAKRRTRKGGRKPSDESHRLAECALRDHVALGRWLRQTPSGRLVIDRAKVAAEERLDGKYLLSTSRPGPVRRGCRARLQEPARSRTRLPRPEVHPRSTTRLPPHRTTNPRPRPALLARPAAHPRRRTTHRTDLAAHRHRARPRPRRHPHQHQPGPSCRPPHSPPSNGALLTPAASPNRPASPTSTPPDQDKHGRHGPSRRVDTRGPLTEQHITPAHTPKTGPSLCPPTAEPGRVCRHH